MEIIIGIIVALFGGLLFFKKKADKSAVEAKLAETKGRDKELEMTQDELEASIKEIDNNLDRINEERKAKKKADDNLTLAERRKRIKEGL